MSLTLIRSLVFAVLFYLSTAIFVVGGSFLLFGPRRWAMAGLKAHAIVSLWLLLPLLLAIGGVNLAIWGVALHTLPTLVLIYYVNRELGMFDWKRELAVLPILAVGALCGELLTLLFR